MRLDDLPPATSVFIDANIFHFTHFTGASEECTRFLQRCEAGELTGVTSISVLLEVLHRLMMLEAVSSRAVRPPRIREKLRKRPEVVRSLAAYTHTARIPEMGISVRPLPEEIPAASQRVRREHGLLVGDSLLLAVMRTEGVRTLATHDADMSRIEEITVAVPADV